MRSLKNNIKSTKPTLKLLPILHSCSGYSFRSILDSKSLNPNECDVFDGEKYLYSYYGIPSYRQMKKDAYGHPAYFPVCFIFDYDKIATMKRLHPFDTGAFKKSKEFRDRYFYPEMTLENFELNPDILDAMRIVQKYFSTNINYIQKTSQYRISEVSAMDFEEFSYVSIIDDETNGKLDSRIATIELIHDQKILLNSDSLLHIILPERFLDDQETERIIKEDLKVLSPDTYLIIKGNPNEFFGVIYNEYIKYIKKNNLD